MFCHRSVFYRINGRKTKNPSCGEGTIIREMRCLFPKITHGSREIYVCVCVCGNTSSLFAEWDSGSGTGILAGGRLPAKKTHEINQHEICRRTSIWLDS